MAAGACATFPPIVKMHSQSVQTKMGSAVFFQRCRMLHFTINKRYLWAHDVNSGCYTSLKVMLLLIRHSFAWSTVQNIFFGLMNNDLLPQSSCFSCLWALPCDWLPLTNQRFEQEVSYLLSATSSRVTSTKTLCVMYADLVFGIFSSSTAALPFSWNVNKAHLISSKQQKAKKGI